MASEIRTCRDIRYKKNFLTNVICRIDFPPILELVKTPPAKFQRKIRSSFPELKKLEAVEFKTTFQKNKKIDEKHDHLLFAFGNKDFKRKVELTFKYLAIEFTDYINYKDFSKIVKSVIVSFCEIYKVSIFSRLGLRYINQISLPDGNPLVWDEILNPRLTYHFSNFCSEAKIARSMTQTILVYEDFKMNFISGIFNSDFPQAISRKEFILDLDCFADNIEKDSVFPKLLTFNQVIKDNFEKSIEDGLREKMEIINE